MVRKGRQSVHTSRVSYQAGTYLWFLYHEVIGVFLLPLYGMLVHCRVTPSIKFAGTHLYAWVEGGTVRVKYMYLAQEHSTMFPARAQTLTT